MDAGTHGDAVVALRAPLAAVSFSFSLSLSLLLLGPPHVGCVTSLMPTAPLSASVLLSPSGTAECGLNGFFFPRSCWLRSGHDRLRRLLGPLLLRLALDCLLCASAFSDSALNAFSCFFSRVGGHRLAVRMAVSVRHAFTNHHRTRRAFVVHLPPLTPHFLCACGYGYEDYGLQVLLGLLLLIASSATHPQVRVR
jgi:hypothetical protein